MQERRSCSTDLGLADCEMGARWRHFGVSLLYCQVGHLRPLSGVLAAEL